MTVGSGMKNIIALIPNVGEWEGRLCGRRITRYSAVGETCVWKIESNTIRTERERDTHKEV